MENPTHSESTAQRRQRMYETITATLKMNGIPINEKTMSYMQPLLDGSMTIEEHRAMLEAIINGIEND